MCTPSLASLRIASVPLGAVLNHLSFGLLPPLFAGSWLTSAIGCTVRRMCLPWLLIVSLQQTSYRCWPIDQLYPTPMVPTGQAGPLRLKTGFHERTCPHDKDSAFDAACCCFEQRREPTTTSGEEALSRNQPKEKNLKRDSES